MIIVPNGFLQHACIFLIISCIDLYNDVFIVAIITFNNSLNLIYGHLLLTSLFRARLLWYCWTFYSSRPKCRKWLVFFFNLLPLLVLSYQPNNYFLWYKMQMTNFGIFSAVHPASKALNAMALSPQQVISVGESRSGRWEFWWESHTPKFWKVPALNYSLDLPFLSPSTSSFPSPLSSDEIIYHCLWTNVDNSSQLS